MRRITIQEETTKNPITLIGREAGECWGAPTEDPQRNYKRGIDCIEAGHGRTWEFPQVFMKLEGYSARVIRELYTHIGGAPTRLQASTRYINYEKGFDYVVPQSVSNNEEARKIYENAMAQIVSALQALENEKIPREDCAMLLPLGMTSTIVLRTNLRNLVDMSHQRLCTRAYWEFRLLMKDMIQALSEWSEEWAYLTEHLFVPKCELTGYCIEKRGCGRKPAREK